jgi:hypothetical protein
MFILCAGWWRKPLLCDEDGVLHLHLLHHVPVRPLHHHLHRHCHLLQCHRQALQGQTRTGDPLAAAGISAELRSKTVYLASAALQNGFITSKFFVYEKTNIFQGTTKTSEFCLLLSSFIDYMKHWLGFAYYFVMKPLQNPPLCSSTYKKPLLLVCTAPQYIASILKLMHFTNYSKFRHI